MQAVKALGTGGGELKAVETRQLIRRLRRPGDDPQGMPESTLWQTWLELSRRGEAQATPLFLSSLKALHRRRSVGAAELGVVDPDPNEHRMTDDPYLGELWKAYKRCIAASRTGPGRTGQAVLGQPRSPIRDAPGRKLRRGPPRNVRRTGTRSGPEPPGRDHHHSELIRLRQNT